MGQLVEVLAVEAEEVPSELLLGASVDTPAPGRRLSAHAVEIGGWALGRDEAVGGVEATHEGDLLKRVSVGQPRTDIGEAFPDLERAGSAGFELELDVGGLPADAEVAVQVLAGDATVPIARLRLRRYWRGRWEEKPPLVSIVVTPGSGESDLEKTKDSLAAQRWPLSELVVAETEGEPAAIRNEAIRRSDGDLLLFLAAGVKPTPKALAAGVGRLAAAEAACGLIDGEPGDAVTAALYRRSAFEELEGFDPAAPDCDRELAERARGLGALFEPGSLCGGGG